MKKEGITKMKKRIISLIVTVMMMSVTLPLQAFATNSDNVSVAERENILSDETTSENEITENIVSSGVQITPDESVLNDPVMTPENRAKLEEYEEKLMTEMETEEYLHENNSVSLSSVSIPTFQQYLADYNYNYNCYSFYNNDFKLPYRSFVETKMNSKTYQSLLTAWRVATFELSDFVEYSTKEIGFYEAILYDILYQGKDVESLSGMLKDCVDGVEVSTLKKVADFIGKDIQEATIMKLSDLTDDEFYALVDSFKSCEELSDVFGAIGNISKGLGYAKNVEELAYKLAKAQVIAQTSNETAKILITMKNNTSNLAMQHALDNMILICSNTVSEATINYILSSEMVVGETLDYVLGEVWGDVLKHLTTYGYAVQVGQALGKTFTHWLFSTDEDVEMYYSMCALYEFENSMKKAMNTYENSYKSSKSNANSKVFNECYKMLLRTFLFGAKVSQEYVDIEYKHGAINELLFYFKETEYEDYSKKLRSITKNVELTIEFMNTVAYNGYLDEYCSDIVPIIGIAKKDDNYTESEKENTIATLNSLSFETNNLIITKDMTLSSDMHTYGNIFHKSGTLKLNGHTLEIDGDYIISSGMYTDKNGNEQYSYAGTARLDMTNNTDKVIVNGDFKTYGYRETGLLTAGVFELKGNFEQHSFGQNITYGYNFDTTGTHKVIFNGNKLQTISFDSTSSGFKNLQIDNEIGTIVFNNKTVVLNNLAQPGGAKIQNRDNVTLQGKSAFEDHGELNASINKYVGNAENVIPTWKDYEAYIAQSEKPAYPYEIKNISIKSNSGTDLEHAPTNQGFVVNVDLLKQTDRDERDYVFVAVYGTQGELLSMNYVQAKLNVDFLYSFSINILAQPQPIGSVKAFVWNTFNSMQPLAESKNL